MKKTIILFASLMCLISCSWLDSKKSEEIEKRVTEAKSEIVKAGENQVKEAQKHIEEEIAASLTKANKDIDKLVKISMSKIKEEVQQTLNKEVDKLKSDLSIAIWLAIASLCVAIAGVIFGVMAMVKLRETTLKNFIVNCVTKSHRIDEFLENQICDKINKDKSLVTPEKARTIVKDLIAELKTQEYVTNQIEESTTSSNIAGSTMLKTTKSTNVETYTKQGMVLYARNSTTSVLSDIYSSHQIGKTIYKLNLDSPDSASAIVDLCVDEEDVVARVLRFNDEDLESICSVSRKSNMSKQVRVVKKGKAEKVANSEWNVIEKLEIELS